MKHVDLANHLDAGPSHGKSQGWIMQEDGPGYTPPALAAIDQDMVAKGHDRKLFVSL